MTGNVSVPPKPVGRNPVVYMTEEIKDKLDLYIKFAKGEISGIGEVERSGNDFIVTEVYLLKQECTSGTTEIEPSAIASFLYEKMQEGKDTSKFKLWWHSHYNFNVFWSKTDEENIEAFESDWMLSIVGNQDGDYLARLDTTKPFRLMVHHLDIEVPRTYDQEFYNSIRDEVDDKVKYKVYTYPAGKPWVKKKDDDDWEDDVVQRYVTRDGIHYLPESVSDDAAYQGYWDNIEQLNFIDDDDEERYRSWRRRNRHAED